MATEFQLIFVVVISGVVQACVNAFFTWVANKTVTAKLDTLAEKMKNGKRKKR